MCIAIYFRDSIIFLWATPQISCLLSIDCYYLCRLINHKSGIKTTACVNHVSTAVRCRTVINIVKTHWLFFTIRGGNHIDWTPEQKLDYQETQQPTETDSSVS